MDSCKTADGSVCHVLGKGDQRGVACIDESGLDRCAEDLLLRDRRYGIAALHHFNRFGDEFVALLEE